MFCLSTIPKLKSGMTLLELVMVIGITTVLLLAITEGIVSLYQINSYNIAQTYEVDNARRGLQDWLIDVRELSYSDDGSYPLVRMESNQIGFYSDIDSEPSVEYVEYELIGSELYRRVYKAAGSPPVYNFITPVRTDLLSEYVQNITQGIPTFLYYDTAGVLIDAAISPLTDVRYIEAKIIVNIDPVRSPGEFLLRSGVSPRNLKDNL